MKSQSGFILALVFALIVAIFAVINVDSVEVNYLFGTGQAPLILVILGSVLMGGLIVGVFGTIQNYKLKRTNRSLQRKIQELESNTTNTPVHETTETDRDDSYENETTKEENKEI
ncbi:LapA family protein [Pontibacillus marinus]|uniref:Lipopolysaccharide assembly protein A domain-containing protein n=1 Tax=Pontibacillus marinus BH030004 = DSM 16465 TaxID=1385511 RepID=A0A0A5HL50_9BACI|nr:lipopolysaccharide assembly protein LapA domain-containing protein [Pontibacillus marinus]KGX84357.1 hypothetical protein N783_17230 [Pontibacillus marinus BH030004 = DSM 16465]